MKERLINFDIAKAICIILVVIGHYVENAPNWYMGLHDIIYSFHMPLFMFASGYIYIAFKKEGESYGNFLWKKVRRLLVPYFVVSAIIITIKLASQGHAYVPNPVTAASYLKALYSPEAGYFLWFIWALWWMFVVAPFFKTRNSRLILFAIAVVLHFVPAFLPKEYFCLQQFQQMLIYFALGIICWDFKEHLPHRVHWSIGTLGFIASYTLANKYSLTGGGKFSISWIIPFFGIMMIMQLSTLLQNHKESRKIRHIVNTLTIVSASSYIVYLFHTTFEGFAKAALHKVPILINGQNDIMYAIGALIIVSCGIICPILLHRYVLAKTKITRILFGLK